MPETAPVQSGPRVSLGMPVFNGDDHLAETLDSILAQTYTDFELIICDNASTDATEEICRRYAARDGRIRYVRNERNLGASPNFNKTYELARGEFFKWAAHDDPLAPTYLEACVNMFDESPESVVLVYPRRLLLSYEGEVLGPDAPVTWFGARQPYDRISFARLNRVPGQLFPILVFGLIRSDVLRGTRLIGPYNHADLVLVGELRLLGTFREIPEPLFFTRLHKEDEEFREQRCTFVGEAQWYDTSIAPKKLTPEFTLLWQRLVSVKQSRLPIHKKLWCVACVMFGQFVTRFPGWLNGRRIMAGVYLWHAWERVSVAAVRRAGRWQAPHRLWAVISGLRHFSRSRLGLAFAWPSAVARAALNSFVADRLRNRNDRHARALLEEWASSSNDEDQVRRPSVASAEQAVTESRV